MRHDTRATCSKQNSKRVTKNATDLERRPGRRGAPWRERGMRRIGKRTVSHVKRMETSHVTHHTSHITHHTSHITHHTSHITHHTSHITHHTSHHLLHILRICRRLRIHLVLLLLHVRSVRPPIAAQLLHKFCAGKTWTALTLRWLRSLQPAMRRIRVGVGVVDRQFYNRFRV
jgi:hypothetical protein